MFEKILCPLDFSSGSHDAMRVAARLAGEGDAELDLAYVWHLPPLAYGGAFAYPALAIDQMRIDDEQALAAAVSEAHGLGARRVTSRFLSGVPWEELCEVLRGDPAFDLVVMGTHGRTGVRRLMLGSVAEKVVRHAPCSVLAVRGRDGTRTFRHILCPIDFSDSSRHAMELAAALAAPDGLGIALLHVIELPVTYPGGPETDAFTGELDREASRLLDAWAADLRAKVAVPVVSHRQFGSAAAQAVALLDAHVSFDLVVVGSHGRTGLTRVLLGSVAEQLVRHAPCPVLVARTRG